MNTYDSRNNFRRITVDRRLAERRTVAYAFGSSEWIENIKNYYLSWPISDRRNNNRRSNERRTLDRRLHQLTEQRRSEQKFSKILLTQEERKVIADIYQE